MRDARGVSVGVVVGETTLKPAHNTNNGYE
jgi:hypothetical protein